MLDRNTRCLQPAVLFTLTSLAIFLFQINAWAQSATFTRTDYPILGNNHIVADLNGDGIPDLAANSAIGVGVMLGVGDGTFLPRVNFATGAQSQDVAAGDFNGDGRMDLAAALNNAQFSMALLIGNGNGTFNAPVMFENIGALDDSPSIVATDLNNDGRLDVVLAHMLACFDSPCVATRNITVMLGLGDGTFQTPFEIDVGTGMSRIAVGDFNSDGIKDLGIAGNQAQVYILLGIGDGSFLKQPTITLITDTFGVDGTDIDVADLNGDTIQDLVVAIGLNGSRTAILLGNNDGTFQPARIITDLRLRVPQYQAIADYNRDGFADLAISMADGTEGLFEILLGNGDGTFRAPVMYAVPPPLSSLGGGPIVTGDFNRDGRPDIGLPITGANPGLAGFVNSTGSISVAPSYGDVTATPSTVVGGNSTEVRISLVPGAVAPSNGFSFSVSSSNSTVLQVPSNVFMPGGASSVRFIATTRAVTSTQNINIRIRNNQLGRRNLTVTVVPGTPPAPAPVTLSAIALSATSVVGGNSVQGTVRLSAAATAATVVTLASSNAAATVPATVTVAAGASSASFTVNTTTVSATVSATISGTLDGITRSATLTINPVAAPPPPSTDTVRITRAEFESSKRVLRVEATSTSSNATLSVFVTATGQLLGTLANNGGGQYRAELSVSTNPQNITVRSSLGGVATASVVAK